MCGALLGNSLTELPDSFAAASLGDDFVGKYSPIEQGSDGEYSQVMEIELDPLTGTGLMLLNSNGATQIDSWEKPNLWIRAKKTVEFETGWFGFLGLRDQTGNLNDAKKALSQVEVQIQQEDGNLKVETRVPPYSSNIQGRVDYEILVPREMNIEVHSSNGQVGVTGIHGEVRAHSTNGKMKISKINGPVAVEATNGKVEIEEIDGALMARTTNGKIEAMGVVGPAEIEATNGRIDLGLERAPLEGESIFCRTVNGGVRVSLPNDSAFHADLETFHGSLRSDFPLNVGENENETRWEGPVGQGGGLVKLRTNNGSIEIKSF